MTGRRRGVAGWTRALHRRTGGATDGLGRELTIVKSDAIYPADWRRYFVAVIAVLIVLGGLGAIKGAQIASLISFGEKAKAAGPPPEAVALAKSKVETWESTLDAVGSVASSRGVAVSTQAAGTVTRIQFESGDTVKKGQVLVQLDTRVEQAQLTAQRVRRDLAETNVKRTRMLAKNGVATPAQLDADESALRSANADIAASQAQIALKIIRAPFSGKLGIREVNVGQYLSPGTPIAELEAEKGTFVDFTLPQEQLDEVKVGTPVRVWIEGTQKKHAGSVSAVEPNVDATTRSVRLRATVPNAEATLPPGAFVRVQVVLPDRRKIVAVPATAIVHASYGDSIFVVGEKGEDDPGAKQTEDGKPALIAHQKFVVTGPSRGDFVAVEKGLAAGEQIVSLGAFKLRNNAPVFESDNVKLEPSLAPKVENR